MIVAAGLLTIMMTVSVIDSITSDKKIAKIYDKIKTQKLSDVDNEFLKFIRRKYPLSYIKTIKIKTFLRVREKEDVDFNGEPVLTRKDRVFTEKWFKTFEGTID